MTEYRRPELKDANPTLVSDHLAKQGIATNIRHDEGEAMYINVHSKNVDEGKLGKALASFKPS